MHDLRDGFDSGVATRDFNVGRVVQQAAGKLANLIRESRGEQQVLATVAADGRQQRENLADVADKAHVEHAVGFVEDENFQLRQIDIALTNMIEQSPGCGDEDVDAAAQLRDLRVDAHAAEDHGGFQRQILTIGLHAFGDLRGEFARRREDQRAHRAAAILGAVRLQTVQ